MPDRRASLQWIAAMTALPSAWAQSPAALQRNKNSWPQKPVNLIIPFPAGGTSALLGKQLVQPFQQATQQPLRLQYVGGGGGVQGSAYAATTSADGYNLLIGGSHLATSRALAPDDDFDLIEDLRPLALLASVPMVVLVNPLRMRSRTAMEWLTDLGRKPVRYRMATAGQGSSSHIAAEMLRNSEALQFDYVHFRGSGPALQDLLAGTVDMLVDGVVSCLPHVRSGRLKALAVSGQQRLSVLPDVPCGKELGIAAIDNVTWYGLFAPKALSNATAASIEQVVRHIGQDAALRQSYEKSGVLWGDVYGQAFAEMVKAETMEWAQRLKTMGLHNILQKTVDEG